MQSQSRGQLTQANELAAIVDSFQPGIVHAVGYGSGVFVQQQQQQQQQHAQPSDSSSDGNESAANTRTSTPSTGGEKAPAEDGGDGPMLDLILTVSDSAAFHGQTLERYPNHYSALARICGPNFCTNLQRSERFGAGVYFNPLVDSPAAEVAAATVGAPTTSPSRRRRKIKYGIIQADDLIEDLTTWRWLYVAGRMHKPTVTVEGLEQTERVALAQRQNLDMALAASLLLLGSDTTNNTGCQDTPEVYDLSALYERIAGLSYAGDPRMDVGGEDPDKVSKLVRSDGQNDRFCALYNDSLNDLEQLGLLEVKDNQSKIALNLHDGATRRQLWKSLPRRVNKGTCYGVGIEQPDTSAQYLSNCLVNIVRPAARRQSLKGILTAGILKSIEYAGAKFAKGAFRKLR